ATIPIPLTAPRNWESTSASQATRTAGRLPSNISAPTFPPAASSRDTCGDSSKSLAASSTSTAASGPSPSPCGSAPRLKSQFSSSGGRSVPAQSADESSARLSYNRRLAEPGGVPMDDADPTLERLEDQIGWYDRRSNRNQKVYKWIKVVEIGAAAFIPFAAGLKLPPEVAGGLGVLVTVLEGLLHLNQYQHNWITYRSTCES